MEKLPKSFQLSTDILRARQQGLPVVALESTVITHGLPKFENLSLADDMEKTVRQEGAIPATIAVLDGKIQIGLGRDQLQRLATADHAIKVSLRDFANAIVNKKLGGTTVAGTMFAAGLVGIKVFATGGIGGVHKEARFDVSTDLQALATIPMIVVCAGAKSILDLPATLEYLETMGVPVVGYGTDKFPEFFSPGRNLPVDIRLDTPQDVVKFANTHWELGMKSAVLVCQPIPDIFAIPAHEVSDILEQVSNEVAKLQVEHRITGQEVTPFELKRVKELTNGRSLRANIELLLNNARLAALIALELANHEKTRLTY